MKKQIIIAILILVLVLIAYSVYAVSKSYYYDNIGVIKGIRDVEIYRFQDGDVTCFVSMMKTNDSQTSPYEHTMQCLNKVQVRTK